MCQIFCAAGGWIAILFCGCKSHVEQHKQIVKGSLISCGKVQAIHYV